MEQHDVPSNLGSWCRGKLLGSGAFSGVYSGTTTSNKWSDGEWVLKVSKVPPPKKTKGKSKLSAELQTGARLLFHEYTMYTNFLSKHPGVPRRPFGRDGYGEVDGWRYLVLQKLGDTLKNRVDSCGGSMNPSLALDVTLQALNSLQLIHEKGLVFRDIKPENFMFGTEKDGEQDKLYIVDFGASCKYIQHDGKHLDVGQGPTGTPRFMSINSHQNAPPSRRDDLESLFYMAVWMMVGELPWDDAKSDESLIATKSSCSSGKEVVEALDENLQKSMLQYYDTVRALGVHESPDYAGLRSILETARDAQPCASKKVVKKQSIAAKSRISSSSRKKPASTKSTEKAKEEVAPATKKRLKAETLAKPERTTSKRTRTTRSRKTTNPINDDDENNEESDIEQVVVASKRRKAKAKLTSQKPSAEVASKRRKAKAKLTSEVPSVEVVSSENSSSVSNTSEKAPGKSKRKRGVVLEDSSDEEETESPASTTARRSKRIRNMAENIAYGAVQGALIGGVVVFAYVNGLGN